MVPGITHLTTAGTVDHSALCILALQSASGGEWDSGAHSGPPASPEGTQEGPVSRSGGFYVNQSPGSCLGQLVLSMEPRSENQDS